MGAQPYNSELSALLEEMKDPLESRPHELKALFEKPRSPPPAEAAEEFSETLFKIESSDPPLEHLEQPATEANEPADIKEDNGLLPTEVRVPLEDTEMSPSENVPRKYEAQPIVAELPADASDDPSRILFQRETELPVGQSQPSAANTGKVVEMENDASPPDSETQEPKETAETSPSKRPKRDIQCEFCEKQQAKYRCPGCGTQTCSLECSKGHKKQSGCKGQRVKTAMVAIGEFDENNLISDYNFLEETLRQNEAARRLGRSFQAGPFFRHPPRLMQLITQARNRRIELILLPVDMSRRKENTSFYDKRRKCFYWRVEWRFPSADLQLVTPKMDEHQTPLAALNALLEPRPGSAATRHKLREYCAMGADKLTFLLRKDCCKAPEPVYIKLDPAKRLRSLLEGKTLIEFPVLTLALPSELERYTIVEETVDPLEPTWESSSGRDAQSEGNGLLGGHSHHEAGGVGILSAFCATEGSGLPKAHSHQEAGGVGMPPEQPDESGPPEEAPIVRARDLEGSGHKQEGSEEFPLELAALLGEAAMADFHRKRKATDLEPGEIAGK